MERKLHLIKVIRIWNQRAIKYAIEGLISKSSNAVVKSEQALNQLEIILIQERQNEY
jgi:glycerol kinase